MPAGIVTLSSNVIVGQSGTKVLQNLSITAPTPVLGTQELTFGSGTYIQLAPPAGATLMVIAPPSANTVHLFLSVASSGGVAISESNFTSVAFPAAGPTGNYYLGSSALVTGSVEVSYI